MTTSMMKKNLPKKLLMKIVLICMVMAISGCAEVQKTFKQVWSNLQAQMAGGQTDSRDEAIRRYNYQGRRDQIFIESSRILPSVASAGTEITQEVVFGVLAPRPEKTFKVQEVVTLSGGDILVELSRKDSDKAQGIHSSTVTFVIPGDLPRGNYRLVTSVSANGLEMKQTGSFTVQ